MDAFKKLGLCDAILNAVKKEGFVSPTEVQKLAIPLVLAKKDVIAESATGSGKTLAFSSGIINTVVPGAGVQALILCPTRELAMQVAQNIKLFSKSLRMNVVSIYGGMPIGPQIRDLKKADVVVGTPGRVLDHIQRQTIHLNAVSTAVLDEADRMLDMGFVDDVNTILSRCNRNRQTLFFTATLSREVTKLAKHHMKKYELVQAATHVDPTKLTQVYYEVGARMKFSLLVKLLQEDTTNIIVFCNSKRDCRDVAKNLRNHNIDARDLHGGLEQRKRMNILKKFHKGEFNVLVCTDVAARGLHIPEISHVYNYDVPQDAEQYVHRIGRTARAGASGVAITFWSLRDRFLFSRVQRINRVKIQKLETPKFERVDMVRSDSGRKGSHAGASEYFRKLREGVTSKRSFDRDDSEPKDKYPERKRAAPKRSGKNRKDGGRTKLKRFSDAKDRRDRRSEGKDSRSFRTGSRDARTPSRFGRKDGRSGFNRESSDSNSYRGSRGSSRGSDRGDRAGRSDGGRSYRGSRGSSRGSDRGDRFGRSDGGSSYRGSRGSSRGSDRGDRAGRSDRGSFQRGRSSDRSRDARSNRSARGKSVSNSRSKGGSDREKKPRHATGRNGARGSRQKKRAVRPKRR